MFWNRWCDQAKEGSAAECGRAGKGQEEKTFGFSGHPLICQSEYVQQRPESLPGNTQGTSIVLMMPVASLRWRMGTACLTRTYVLRWTHLCSRVMTPQPVESPGSSMLWPHTLSTNKDAERKFRVSWGMDPPLPGKSLSRHALILWVGRRSSWSPVYLTSRMDFISGITWTRFPTPPCASKKP